MTSIKYERDIYNPHENQRKIHESNARYRVVVAGRRFGKSALALNEALVHALSKKKQIVWIILPTYKQAKEIYWIDPDIVKYYMPLVQLGLLKKNDSDLSLFCPSTESWVRLKGSDNADSLRGSGIDLLIWDEVADVKPYAFEVIRPSLADSPNHRVLYIGTPKGFNHFHDLALLGDHNGLFPKAGKDTQLQPNWMAWHFTSYDNKAWKEESLERQEFVKFLNQEKLDRSEDYFAQEYLADFRKAVGLAHKLWDRNIHLIDPFDVPKDWIRGRGFDYGSAHPTASVRIAVDKQGIWFVERCYKQGQLTIQDHAHVILSQDYGYGFIPSWGDPSGGQWFQEFDKHGVHIQRADKSRGQGSRSWVEHGVERINEKLKSRHGRKIHLPDKRVLVDCPAFFVLNTPENQALIKEIELLRWRETKEGQTIPILNQTLDPDGHFDLMAALRYFAVSWTEGGEESRMITEDDTTPYHSPNPNRNVIPSGYTMEELFR